MTEAKQPEECPVCDIASAFAVAKGICNTFRDKGLDCTEFLKTLDDPDGMASDGVKEFLKMREQCQLPEVKEMLDYITKAAQLESLEFAAPTNKEPEQAQPAA